MNSLRAWALPLFLWLPLLLSLLLSPLSWGATIWPAVLGLLLALWVGWHRQQLLHLTAWFQQPRAVLPPLAAGIWEETFAAGYHWRRDQETVHRHLTAQIVQLRDALEAMPDAVLLLDGRGQLRWVNQSSTQLLQLQWPEDMGKPLRYWLRTPRLQRFFTEGETGSIQIPSPADPQQTLEGLRYPLADAGALVIFRDVTRIRHLEQVRQDFVANVSHELRSPLTVVRGFLETLLDGPLGADPEVGPQLRLMEQQTLRMQSLVEDLLTLARIEAAQANPEECEPIFIAALVEDYLRVLADAIATKKFALICRLDPDLGVFAQPLDMASVVRNLLENAMKYTPSDRKIEIVWEKRPEGLVFSVRDSGDGIGPEHLQRITERFYRVDKGRSRQLGGTGLGLAIVKHAIERYNGHLEIESRLGMGSRFSARFPLRLARSAPADEILP
ncbi:phosphate regulon sensor histidine kinase PhoR [Acidithiobacillus sulfuriphilus]|uniref:Phosphate regulon sensor protein PhoR n=2 Tax=Acidithiobacillus sulfuriphilus TaxID=1867749 RepID=A0A3M8QVX6_9PROT|nr:phosphate regulon sensor histidine kinase PhoR [Acidithiobacillus sulfuriphilus]RNF59602.1 phosphate regulon sensor histidine kinase PhoR [Acidithiobacillus sulfuriphilus]